MGWKRRTRPARWRCTACASDVEGSVVVVVAHHPMIYDVTLLREPLSSTRLSLAPVCGKRVTDEFYATRSFTRLVTYVNESCDLSRRPLVRERRVANDVICAALETSTCTTARQIEAMRVLWEKQFSSRCRSNLTLIQLILCFSSHRRPGDRRKSKLKYG